MAGLARPQPRRPPLPGPRRRRQTPRPATVPGVDRPQRLRPRRHADRDVRLHGRPAAVPPEPGARPQLPAVPRPDRCAPPPAGRRPGRGDVLALGPAARRHHVAGAPRSPRCAPRPRRWWPSPSTTSWPSSRARWPTWGRRPTPTRSSPTTRRSERSGPSSASTRCPSPMTPSRRALGPGAVVRRAAPGRLRHRGHRRRPRRPAARLGGVGRGGVGAGDLDRDATGGLNGPATSCSTCPPSHATSVIGSHSAGWLRCRVLDVEDRPAHLQRLPA